MRLGYIETWKRYGDVYVERYVRSGTIHKKGQLKTWFSLKEFEELKPEIKPKLIYRLTVGLNYVVQHKYYSYKIQVWGDKKDLLDQVQDAKEKVKTAVEKLVGYPSSEWWFPDTPNVALDEAKAFHKTIEGVELVSKHK